MYFQKQIKFKHSQISVTQSCSELEVICLAHRNRNVLQNHVKMQISIIPWIGLNFTIYQKRKENCNKKTKKLLYLEKQTDKRALNSKKDYHGVT